MDQEESANWLRKATEVFAETRGLKLTPRLYEVGLASYWVINGMFVLREELGLRTDWQYHEPAWWLLYAALERVFEHAEASVIALGTGSFATAEVIARVTVEAAINVRYILKGHPFERLLDYFSDYIKSEREKVDKWQNILRTLDEDERKISLDKILQKTAALDGYEEKLRQVAEKIHPPVDGQPVIYQPQRWPNAFDRFVAVGDAHAYRTVYSALSSQVHNVAEDLLNRFILEVHKDANLIQAQLDGNEKFARMATYNAITMALEAARTFAQHMGLQNADEELASGEAEMETASAIAAAQLQLIGVNPGDSEAVSP